MRNFPVRVRDGLVRIAWAASATMSGVRQFSARTPSIMAIAAVAITVFGHKALTAIPSEANSGAMPSTQKLMPNLAMVYATCGSYQRGSMVGGGDNISTCGFCALLRKGRHACVVRKVPRVLT